MRLNINRQEQCETCKGQRLGRRKYTSLSGVQRIGPCRSDGRRDAFNLTCQRCQGKGRLRNTCPTCYGDGRVTRTGYLSKFEFRPACRAGSQVARAGKGQRRALRRSRGRSLHHGSSRPTSFFQRDGDNIEIRVPVTVTEAGLGAKIEVPTIDGRALLKIPQGTQNGQKFRLTRKGRLQCQEELARRSDRRSRAAGARRCRTNGRRNCCASLAQVQTEDPREEIWAKV